MIHIHLQTRRRERVRVHAIRNVVEERNQPTLVVFFSSHSISLPAVFVSPHLNFSLSIRPSHRFVLSSKPTPPPAPPYHYFFLSLFLSFSRLTDRCKHTCSRRSRRGGSLRLERITQPVSSPRSTPTHPPHHHGQRTVSCSLRASKNYLTGEL